ncbi:nucleotidyl transferase AbiEii/AbiGii toxin family protein [Belliella kenyensis]|uniref:Nucleotidyl transferase AbiEii/AbiGii toxin family protein n=1 Tax=Belliella kenyensis TaxID=1472724 RepID=A0ABV8ETA7_9BACT
MGGYKVEFKLIGKGEFDKFNRNIESARRNAIQIHTNNSPIFELEFSKHEYVKGNKDFEYEGFKIRIYTPEMIVFEKLRALCQQLPEYNKIVPGFSPRARARDFYDIHFLMEEFEIAPEKPENLKMLSEIFSAKKVPLEFITILQTSLELHKENWTDVKTTVSSLETIKDFDYYFEYVLSKFEKLTFL